MKHILSVPVSVVGVIPLAILLVIMVALAAGTATGTTATCTNPATLSGSAFEIDKDANLKVDTTGCIDWLADGTGSSMRSGVLAKNDKPTGTNDDSFGQGTAENNPNPTIVTGSIPPNKSDLKAFGVYTEDQHLELFWSRVQNPSGTTNMDFELNQKVCEPDGTNCANNGNGVTPETPVRTPGDKLITYDLSNGGTVPTISIRTWTGTAWGPATVISDPNDPTKQGALGSINTSLIPAAESGGATGGLTTALGSQDPYTFGEAAISFEALFGPNTCGKFGSAYLKSRSSDAFTAEIKDFVAPERVNISNCPAGLTTTATTPVTIGSPISDVAHLDTDNTNPTGTITFHLYSDAACTNEVNTALSPVTVNGDGDYNSGNYTPTAVGSYYWTATYSGDATHDSVSTACGDPSETSVVAKKQPAISTDASAPVTIGDPISDVAHLSGATSDANGTITFKLYSDAQCTNEVNTGLQSVTVNGNGDYNSGNYTPTAVGTYYWIASYSGDNKNLAVSGSCNDANESSVVGKAASNVTTAQSLTPQDSVTLTADAGGTPTGTVDFKLYGPNNPTCDAAGPAPVYTEPNVTLSGGKASTSNTTFSVSSAAADTYHWKVVYGGDSTHDGSTSDCTENFTLTIQNG